jgi:hypothetical protein
MSKHLSYDYENKTVDGRLGNLLDLMEDEKMAATPLFELGIFVEGVISLLTASPNGTLEARLTQQATRLQSEVGSKGLAFMYLMELPKLIALEFGAKPEILNDILETRRAEIKAKVRSRLAGV